MASQEADPTELPAACAGEAPGSLGEAAAEDSSAHRPVGRSQNHPEVLRALGAVQILNGAVILALGGCMHALQKLSQASNYFFLLIVSTGYPIWGAIFVSIQIPLIAYHYAYPYNLLRIPFSASLPIFKQFIVSGILSTLAGKKPTKTLVSGRSPSFSVITGAETRHPLAVGEWRLVSPAETLSLGVRRLGFLMSLQDLGCSWLETSMGLHTSSAVMALVGIVFLSMNLFANDPLLKGCQSSWPPDLCTYMEASSNGLVSLMLILTLLELCIACSVVALWLKANCWHLRKAISSLSNPGESRMPPNESKEIQS
ncbi:PREDICTED: membrane-spanning 4-domains subfamily A member 3 [Bison bison bison]|uniref:Membrane-spanning 4-domains subfamily A member 3 n=1 Tax=Bison bison bison TaxID=43346 RepID=A0A6P3HIA9_BISBB|nr:PREDICTED: membrane-spanning 4-domains subfamily A member 3 [Bison bison bison]